MTNAQLRSEVRVARARFLDEIAPHRPALYRHCRGLTGSAFDAEDLVQDTCLKAFARLSEVHHELRSPRAYLFTIATRLFLNSRRRPEPESLREEEASSEVQPLGPEVREALERLVSALPPRARAAVLLFDVCGLSLSETARAMSTTVGAVKAALHRGRSRLEAARTQEAAGAPSPLGGSSELVDRFVAAFNARDLDGLAAILEEDAEASVVGCVLEEGRQQIRDGSLHHTMFDEEGDPRASVVELWGERLVVLHYAAEGQRRLGDILRLDPGEAEGVGLRRLRYYYFCPELLAEAAVGLSEEQAPFLHGYRYPSPTPPSETA